MIATEQFWIPGPWQGRLAISPRPRGADWLEDEVRAWRESRVDVIVSLLTEEEVALFDLQGEAELSQGNGIRFISLPILDRGVPSSRKAFLALVNELRDLLTAGKTILVHCRQGIGRAGLLAASLLVHAGVEPQLAMQTVSSARHCAVPETAEQRQWITSFAPPTPPADAVPVVRQDH